MCSAYQKGKSGQVGAVWSASTAGITSVLVQQDVTLSEPHSLVDGTGWQVLLNPLQVFLLRVGREGRRVVEGGMEGEGRSGQVGQGEAVTVEGTESEANLPLTSFIHVTIIITHSSV